MATEYTIAMTLNATPDGRADSKARTEVELVCGYTLGRPGCFYHRNGDPGDPPEPDEAWVVAVWLDGVKLTDDMQRVLGTDLSAALEDLRTPAGA